jgi:fructose-bisphosphate aldolase, class I
MPIVNGGPLKRWSSMDLRPRPPGARRVRLYYPCRSPGKPGYTFSYQGKEAPNHMEIKTATEQKSLLATLAPGKRTRLRRLLFEFGPGHGTLLLLPIDQGIEHGPRDFFPNPASKDPEYQFHLAAEAGYSAIACQIGLAEKYYPDYAGQVPLILKVNGKTDIPSSDDALSTTNASVEDAVRLGADAVGYTLYVGSPRQDLDLHQLKGVREDCDRYGMPLVIWAYPRGAAIDKKGGHVSFYAIDYAARLAMEMGADVVKLNLPKIDPEKDKDAPAPYNELDVSQEEAVRQVVQSAGRSLVVLSGGSKIDDDQLLQQTRYIMESGGSGVIYGRNVWQRGHAEAMEIVEQIKEVLLSSVTRIP